jgi:hypothetical protein
MGLFTERDEETTNEIIIGKLNRIEAKLDAVIKALHEYDGNDEYGESSFEAFQLTNEYLSSLNEEEMERRMDIIGQNGNEGLHYNDTQPIDDSEQVPLEILQAEQLRQWEEERGKEDYYNDTQDKGKHVGGKKGKRKFNGNKKNSTNSGR